MVYGGKPSTGCQNCRQRHIKCDETRPACKACLRTGRTCPGYKHPFDVVLRERTAFQRKKNNAAAGKSSDRAGDNAAVPAPSPSSSAPTGALLPAAPISPVRLNPGIPRRVNPQLEATVTSLFFGSYMYLPKDPQLKIGFMELVPLFYSTTNFGSHLHLASLAVAFRSVAAWTGHRPLLHYSEQFFVRALARTRVALQGVEENPDAMLMTVLLLSTFEQLAALKERRTPTKAHLAGAIALLNTQGAQRKESPFYAVLSHAVQTQVVRSAMGLGHPMIQVPERWPRLSSTDQTGPWKLTVAASEIVGLKVAWEGLASSPKAHDHDEIRKVLSLAIRVDSQLAAWPDSVPPRWTPVPASYIPQSVREAGIFQDRCDCYLDIWVASTWNLYRDSRIVVHNTILDCLRLLVGDEADETQAALATIQSLATDICASIPFFLGNQTKAVVMDPLRVEFPGVDGKPASLSHRKGAPLLGGWFAMSYLYNLCSPRLGLHGDQLAWIKGQMQRVMRIYTHDGRLF
ncbi:Zn(II)2Cys6 transcription factor domain-containing protein [Aspergillus clavatus NRRL 1]|uniref:C6 zinc finger domain protein n=1 Tax=Aspergillus clavatus (strain ATCC 1007 / CBS 513.65 / DSM 816 / NCTC 3887 / NRRL 1 / QM 1276 / 107) TaxID=344612 RepID=A1CJM0_ASPCL|nr:C6 zinc finger domain protein [Aspergillus clavatus NRRL 1]EAW09344.1 C6 zinc finger domain protein [Aspergillus clavatus NRRL 1]